MAHQLQLFIGHPEVLRRFSDASRLALAYRLTAGAELAVIPLHDALVDDLHRGYGTGEWHTVLRLTTADLTFAAETSRRGALAYIETDYGGGDGYQASALWGGGGSAIRPLAMTVGEGTGRPRPTWPINAALRGLGVVATLGRDEFETFGLGPYRHLDDITARAMPLRQ